LIIQHSPHLRQTASLWTTGDQWGGTKEAAAEQGTLDCQQMNTSDNSMSGAA